MSSMNISDKGSELFILSVRELSGTVEYYSIRLVISISKIVSTGWNHERAINKEHICYTNKYITLYYMNILACYFLQKGLK